jgi:AraC family transcriptional regulator
MAAVRPTTSDLLGWTGLRVEHLTGPPDTEVDLPAVTHHWLFLTHRPAPDRASDLAPDFSIRFAGQERTEPGPPGSISIIPAGTPSQWRWRGASESTHVLVEPQLLARVAAEALDLNPDRVEIPPVFDLSHPSIRDVLLALDAELNNGGPGGRLLAESLGNVLAVHLLRHFCAPRLADPSPRRGLSKPRLRAVIEHIHENLDAELSLDHLAAVARMSPYHFARLFKDSTGLPPHQYVIARRVERAKELLRGHDPLPLADVAVEAGFSSQSHFTHHFKRFVGVTPRRFQSAARTR